MLHRALPMEYMTPYPKAKAVGCPTFTYSGSTKYIQWGRIMGRGEAGAISTVRNRLDFTNTQYMHT